MLAVLASLRAAPKWLPCLRSFCTHPLGKHPDAVIVEVLHDVVQVLKRPRIQHQQHRLPPAAQARQRRRQTWSVDEGPLRMGVLALYSRQKLVELSTNPKQACRQHTMPQARPSHSRLHALALQRAQQAAQAAIAGFLAVAPVRAHNHAELGVGVTPGASCQRVVHCVGWRQRQPVALSGRRVGRAAAAAGGAPALLPGCCIFHMDAVSARHLPSVQLGPCALRLAGLAAAPAASSRSRVANTPKAREGAMCDRSNARGASRPPAPSTLF